MVDKELARLDPTAVFASPEEVRDHGELETDEKIEILKRWAYDDAETSVAGEEGMPGEAANELQQRIFVALESLGGEGAVEPVGPTKHHGVVGSRAAARDDTES